MVALTAAGVAHASHIALTVEPQSHLRDGRVHVEARITNHGDEPAWNLSSDLLLREHRIAAPDCDLLDAGSVHRFVFPATPPPTPRGIDTAVIRVRYEDANGHPFSVLSPVSILTADPSGMPDALTVRLEGGDLGRDGRLDLHLESSLPEPLPVEVRVFVPDEIEIGTAPRTVMLEPGTPQSLAFRLRNSGALAGSRYRVLAVVEAELNGKIRSWNDWASVHVREAPSFFSRGQPGFPLVAGVLLLAFAFLQLPRVRAAAGRALPFRPPTWNKPATRLFFACIVAVLFVFTLLHLHPAGLVADTTTTGGDTPAHNYLASHLRDQLFGHGRIVSWAPGWWCGFPMFQFYFCLPYVLAALADCVLPFNVAFKLVSVAGILLLPAAAALSVRWMRLPRPTPLLLAIAMVPFLFVRAHTMWGVSIYSTLAGMISNSISFPLFLLFTASAERDTRLGRPHARTGLLLTLLLASHFFTSVMAAFLVLFLLVLPGASTFKQRVRALLPSCVLGTLLMAWWLVPLAAKLRYTVDFGSNWNVDLLETFPPFVLWLSPFFLIGTAAAAVRRNRFILIHLFMAGISLLLYRFGYEVAHVFVNIRLWPFLLYAIIAVEVAGLGLCLSRSRAQPLAVSALLVAALAIGVRHPEEARGWARWNYEGLERKPLWPVFEKLVLPLSGTPGRLANDLHEANNQLGSTRVFETVPHLIDKPILEGGLVSSALGALFAYSVQGEASESSAGYPNGIPAASFDFALATRHMQLFNVKHFIARGAKPRAALAASSDWKFLARFREWDLYELITHDGRMVTVPAFYPRLARSADYQQTALDWFATPAALDRPLILLQPGQTPPPGAGTVLSGASLQQFLDDPVSEAGTRLQKAATQRIVTEESVEAGRIRFRTEAPGKPHIIKCSYAPDWKSRGGEEVYMVTPAFLCIFPREQEVDLYYGRTLSDTVGQGLTVFAAGVAIAVGIWNGVQKRRRRASGVETSPA